MTEVGGLKRRNVASNKDNQNNDTHIDDDERSRGMEVDEDYHDNDITNSDEESDKSTRLTLMEEILLLGLKEREGYTSFWNDCISSGLRGCILLELAIRKRIELEGTGLRRRACVSRRIKVINSEPTGDALLDEALRHIKITNPIDNVPNWIEYLSGESWNPLKLRYQLKNVRERIAKNLVEKGVCTTGKQNFVIFDLTTHPVNNSTMKQNLVRKIQEAVLTKWPGEAQRMSKRLLCLLMMAHSSDVLENAFQSLNDVDYELASKRMRELLNLEPDQQCTIKPNDGVWHLMWAVIATFLK
ncbi:hypothetical protein SNEBB_006049 [Seison nebaliae]|nr:hypothetical protein SNEBB_006049 [Seison nebaliae]